MILKRLVKFFTTSILVILIGISILFLYLFVVSYGFTDSRHYTPKHWILYNFYTIEEVKKAPYLTDESIITFFSQDGTRNPSYGIQYDGKRDIKELENYLTSLGYSEEPDHVFGTLWFSESGDKKANIYDAGENTYMWFMILYY